MSRGAWPMSHRKLWNHSGLIVKDALSKWIPGKQSLHREGCWSDLTDQSVESSNFFFQDAVFSLSPSLFLFSDLKCFHQMSIFHIEVLEQQIRFCVLLKLDRGESYTFYCESSAEMLCYQLATLYSSIFIQTIIWGILQIWYIHWMSWQFFLSWHVGRNLRIRETMW